LAIGDLRFSKSANGFIFHLKLPITVAGKCVTPRVGSRPVTPRSIEFEPESFRGVADESTISENTTPSLPFQIEIPTIGNVRWPKTTTEMAEIVHSCQPTRPYLSIIYTAP
jgi:hypothetical protein